MGTPPPKTRELIKRIITLMECDTPESKERWIGHPSIPLRMFGLSQEDKWKWMADQDPYSESVAGDSGPWPWLSKLGPKLMHTS